jgi:hypothetical protein
MASTYASADGCHSFSAPSSISWPRAFAGYNPTGTVGALAYHAMDPVVKRYVKSPGNLAG